MMTRGLGAFFRAAGLLTATALSVSAADPVWFCVAWGDNSSGQTNVPVVFAQPAGVACATVHTVGLQKNGTAAGWGDYYRTSQTNISPASNIVAVAGGFAHDVAVLANGSVYASGDTGSGESLVPADATNVVAVACGFFHTVGVCSDGRVLAWGANTDQQTNVPPGLNNAVAVGAGAFHSVALRGDGTVTAWGAVNDAFPPTEVPPGLTDVVAISAGGYHNLALKRDGTVVAFGQNTSGQCSVPPDLTNVVAVAGGGDFSLALKANGRVVAWGNTANMGAVSSLTNIVAISAGLSHAAAIGVVPFPGAALRLTNAVYSGFTFSVPVATARGSQYFLEYKTNLAQPHWAMLPPVGGDGTVRVLADREATSPSRFYQVRRY